MTAARTGKWTRSSCCWRTAPTSTRRSRCAARRALMWAAAENNADVVAGADRGRRRRQRASNGGFTPLLFAVRAGRTETVRCCSSNGADPNDAIDGRVRPRGDAAAGSAAGRRHRQRRRRRRRNSSDPLRARCSTPACGRPGHRHRGRQRTHDCHHQRAFRAGGRTARPRRRSEQPTALAGRRCTSSRGPGGRRFSTACRRRCRPADRQPDAARRSCSRRAPTRTPG